MGTARRFSRAAAAAELALARAVERCSLWVAVWWAILLLVTRRRPHLRRRRGYLVLLVDISLGSWRLNHWTSRRYSRGLRDYQS